LDATDATVGVLLLAMFLTGATFVGSTLTAVAAIPFFFLSAVAWLFTGNLLLNVFAAIAITATFLTEAALAGRTDDGWLPNASSFIFSPLTFLSAGTLF